MKTTVQSIFPPFFFFFWREGLTYKGEKKKEETHLFLRSQFKPSDKKDHEKYQGFLL